MINLTTKDLFYKPELLNFKLLKKDGLLLLEYKHQEVTPSGLILTSLTYNIMGQPHRLPKWKVIMVGEDVPSLIDVNRGDFVIVSPDSGKQVFLYNNIECRFILAKNVIAKIVFEPKDVYKPKNLNPNLKWQSV